MLLILESFACCLDCFQFVSGPCFSRPLILEVEKYFCLILPTFLACHLVSEGAKKLLTGPSIVA